MKPRLSIALKALLVVGLIIGAIVPIAQAAVWTDLADYSPGDVVTIHGDNSDGAGYLPGETVAVVVNGPNGYYETCDAEVAADGSWACNIQLWPDERAVGPYTYTATGLASGVSQSGTFTDGNASVSGTVKDTGGTAIAGATIECTTSSGCNAYLSTTTNASGEYFFDGVAGHGPKLTFGNDPVNLTITASKVGYSSVSITVNNVKNKDDKSGINFTLAITDSTPPDISYVLNPATPDGSNGWYRGNVTLTWTVTEIESPTTLVKTGCVDQSITTDQATTNYTCSASSAGGSAGLLTVTIKRDSTSPGITWNGSILADDSFVYGAVPAVPTCTATDSVSGPGTCAVTGYVAEVGPHTLTATAYDQAGNVKTETRNYSVTKTNAICSVTGYTGTYDAEAHGATGTCTGVGGTELPGLTLGESFTDYPGGTAHWAFAGGTNYNDQSGDVAITITKADATCSVSGYTGVYNAAAHGASGSCAGISDEAAGTLALGASFSNVPGGTAHWVFTGNGNYNDKSGDVAITITKADASCSVVGYTGVYDAVAHGAAGSCSGIGDESAGTLGLGASFTDVPGGMASWTFTGNGNYKDQSGEVTIAISKAEASCSVVGYSSVYDAEAHGASGSCAGIGDDVAGTLNLGGSFTNVPGGTAHWTFTGGTNYNDLSGDVAITITMADATCSVSGYSSVYDAAAHGATGTCVGIGHEAAGTLDLGASFTNVPGGTAHWVFTGNGNYKDQTGTAEIVIEKADAVCTVSGYIGVYDAVTHGASGSCAGIGGEAAGTLNLGASFTDVPGGTAHWVLTGNGNYNDESGTAEIVINKADALCSVIGYTGTYDTHSHGASGKCTGVAGVVLPGLTLGDSFINVSGGTAQWTFAGGTNYNDQSGTVEIVIAKADAVCTVSGYSGIYDATAHGATGSCTGIGSESAGALDLGANFTNVPGGKAAWTFTGNGNYKDQSDEVTIAISKADAVCTVSGYSGVYDVLPHGAMGSCSGISGESAGTLDLGPSFTNVPGGTAHWAFTGNGNYNDQSGNAAIVISKAMLTVTADNQTIMFGNPNPLFTFKYTGFVGTENKSVIDTAPTCSVGAIPMYGSYPIVCSGGIDNNYAFTYVDGTLTVQQWTLKGFYQPVDMPTTTTKIFNVVKNGSTVPLKFEIFAGSTELTDIAAIKSFTYVMIPNDASIPEDAIETLATGNTVLRYDATGGQFIFNWKTPNTAGKCYRVTMTTLDGSTLVAYFKLK